MFYTFRCSNHLFSDSIILFIIFYFKYFKLRQPFLNYLNLSFKPMYVYKQVPGCFICLVISRHIHIQTVTKITVIYLCFERFRDIIHQYAEYKGNYKYLELFNSLYGYFFWDRNPKPINSRIMNVSLGRCLARKRKLKDTSNIKSILRLSKSFHLCICLETSE